jgi:hypothetical protein
MRNLTVIALLAAVVVAASCSKSAPEARVVSMFAAGDLKNVVLEKANIRDGTQDSEAARYLVDLSRYLVADSTFLEDRIDIAAAGDLSARIEQLTQGSPGSPWLYYAAAVAAQQAGNTDLARQHLEVVKKQSSDLAALRTAVSAVETLAGGSEWQGSMTGSVEGVLRPLAGLMGYLLPHDGETVVKGEVSSSIGSSVFKAPVDGWALLYCPQNTHACGWGLRVRSGEVLVTRASYDAITQRRVEVAADQGFQARAWDPFGRFVLLHFEPGDQGLVLPVQIMWPDDTQQAVRDAVPTPEVGYDGRLYWADDYKGSRDGGVRIDERGRRVMFGTEGMRVKLNAPTEIRGPFHVVSRRGEGSQ